MMKKSTIKKSTLIIFGVSLIGLSAISQALYPSVIASAGTISKGSTISLAWTLGEAAIHYSESSFGMITEGFHQPMIQFNKFPVQLVFEEDEAVILTVSPNPTRAEIHIKSETKKDLQATIYLHTIDGRTLKNAPVNLKNLYLDWNLFEYPAGSYILSVRAENGHLIQSMKISKIY